MICRFLKAAFRVALKHVPAWSSIFVAAIVSHLGHSTCLAQETSRPNFVIVLCDDLGYGDLGCYGHAEIQTPNLDAIASRSLRLTDCYSAAPVCSPSRVGLLTGRSPNRAGVFDWIPPARSSRPDQRAQVHMRRNEVTIAQQMKLAGYATCMVGKWHCNSRFNQTEQPQPGDFGFDHWMATQNNASPSHENPTNFVRNGEPIGKQDGYSCQLVVDEAMRWLDDRNQEQPFFLFTSFHEPHEPIASPQHLVAKYKPQAKTIDQAEYFANVENVDLAVGRLVNHLKKIDAWTNTVFVFTSDNGPETLNRYRSARRSYGSPGPLRGMKLWTTDAGFRVAGIISWPTSIEGHESNQVVSSLDLMPTFCELADVAPPDRRLDGTSLATWLKQGGKDKLDREEPLLWCYYNGTNQRRVAMRYGQWKMLAKLDHGELPKQVNLYEGNIKQVAKARLTDVQLFDITSDLKESNNLYTPNDNLSQTLFERMNRAYQELVADSHVWTRDTSSASAD